MKRPLLLSAILTLLANCGTPSDEASTYSSTAADITATQSQMGADTASFVPIDSNIVELDPQPGQVKMLLPANAKLTQLNNKVKVEIRSIEGYGNNTAFAQATAQKLQDVINSKGFKEAILKNRYAYDRGQDLTPAQLYERIMKAHEEDGPGGQDGIVDLRLRTLDLEGADRKWKKWCNKSTIGVDGGGSGIAAICPNWLEECVAEKDTASLAAHFVHEYMHVLGFTHAKRKLETVPYKIGDLVEQLSKVSKPKSADM